jgi:hypothetical protein
MNTYTVTVTKGGFIKGVHRDIRAKTAAEACEIAAAFYPPKTRGLKFRAE